MKKIYCSIGIGLAMMMAIASCKKYVFNSPPLASLTVTNAIVGGASIRLGSNATSVTNNSFAQLTVMESTNELYVWPEGDSSHPYYTYNKWAPEDRKAYSLFLSGTPDAVDGILVKENIPYQTDNTAGIRFINLSPNSPALNITLAATPTVNEVTNLGYKQMTEFKIYPAFYNSDYTFEIRDASTNDILTSFQFWNFTLPRGANVTLVIRGLADAMDITLVNNDR